jgi:hypothetical protein
MSSLAGELNTTLTNLFSYIISSTTSPKISLNLFKKYNDLIRFKELSLNNKINLAPSISIIYGNLLNRNNDLIVPVSDQFEIYDSINSIDKKLFETKAPHIKMTTNIKVKKIITEGILEYK